MSILSSQYQDPSFHEPQARQVQEESSFSKEFAELISESELISDRTKPAWLSLIADLRARSPSGATTDAYGISGIRMLGIPVSPRDFQADAHSHPNPQRENLKRRIDDLVDAPEELMTVAQKFLDLLDTKVLDLDIDIDFTTQGDIRFDFFLSTSAMFTVGVCSTGELAFAALFDDSKVNGRSKWNGAIPCVIQCCFDSMVSLKNG